jgi:hypothetical protein
MVMGLFGNMGLWWDLLTLRPCLPLNSPQSTVTHHVRRTSPMLFSHVFCPVSQPPAWLSLAMVCRAPEAKPCPGTPTSESHFTSRKAARPRSFTGPHAAIAQSQTPLKISGRSTDSGRPAALDVANLIDSVPKSRPLLVARQPPNHQLNLPFCY